MWAACVCVEKIRGLGTIKAQTYNCELLNVCVNFFHYTAEVNTELLSLAHAQRGSTLLHTACTVLCRSLDSDSQRSISD